MRDKPWIARHQEGLAQEVATEAARQIRFWNSRYSGDEGNIGKSQAADAVRDAMKAVLARRQSMRPA